ncbi:MAG: histidine triad nucleotide-binding protein [Acidobacteriota bacterium]
MEEKQCVFCSVIRKEINAKIVYEDDKVIAFDDVNPQAPVHVLIIPKEHFESINEFPEEKKEILGYMVFISKKIVEIKGISKKGYRLVLNTGREAGQSIFHIHLHVLGGRYMRWPPG